MTTIGSTNQPVTLSPTYPTVTLTGTIDAAGPIAIAVGGRPATTLSAAIIGPSTANFHIHNIAIVESSPGNGDDAGIILAARGVIQNANLITGANAILMFGAHGNHIENTGTIEGLLGTGAYIYGAGSVKNQGLITGAAYGLYMGAPGTLKNTGTITGATGVSLYYGPSQVDNTGTIEGTTAFGLILQGAITNAASGSVTGSTAGIELLAASTAINHGLVSGSTIGIAIAETALGGYANYITTIQNAGTIAGGLAGIGIYSNNAATGTYAVNITNTATGRITGAHYGIAITYTAVILTNIHNAGTIAGAVGNPSQRQTATPFSAGPAAVNAAILIAGGSVINTGTITGGAAAIYSSGPTYILNTNLLHAANTGIWLAKGGSTVINAGIISGATYGIYQNGYRFQYQPPSLTVINMAGATIAGDYAIYDFYGRATVQNAGTIESTKGEAIRADSITNTGLIESTENFGAAVFCLGTIRNFGTIQSSAGAINSSNIYNYGIISGASYGIYDYAASITNAGTIIGQTAGNFQTVTLANTGLIKGGVTTDSNSTIANFASGTIAGTEIGISLTGENNYLTDAGLISGGTYAIDAAPIFGATRLTLAPTATIQGAVKLFGDLYLNAGATTGTINFTQFQDVASLDLNSNAIWNASGTLAKGDTGGVTIAGTLQLESAAPLTLYGTIVGPGAIRFTGPTETLALGNPTAFHNAIQNFALKDTIELDHVSLSSITAENVQNGILTLTEAGATIQLTFANPSTFAPDIFTLFSDRAGLGITLSTPAMDFATPASTTPLTIRPLPAYLPAQPIPQPPTAAPTLSGWTHPQIQNPTPHQSPLITLHP